MKIYVIAATGLLGALVLNLNGGDLETSRTADPASSSPDLSEVAEKSNP